MVIEAEYDLAYPFINGLAKVYVGDTYLWMNFDKKGVWYYINKNGKIISDEAVPH